MAFTTIQGSGANDATSFVGTSGVDTITINAGTITGAGTVFAGAQEAADTINVLSPSGGVTGYTLRGGQGADTLALIANTSITNSFLNANSNNDTINVANSFTSTVQGGQGNDTIATGLVFQSLVNGNKNNDTLTTTGVQGGSLLGGQGNDTLNVNAGNAYQNAGISGDNDNDTINVAGGTSFNNVTISGGNGNDNIATAAASLTAFTSSTFFGGDGNDTINAAQAGVATDIAVTISGDAGNDQVTGGAAADTLLTGEGIDQLTGGAGNDTLNGGTGADLFTGGAGNDRYVQGASDSVAATATWTGIVAGTGFLTNATSTITFANGVDLVTDFAGAADSISFGTAGATALAAATNVTALATGNYFVIGTWAPGTNSFQLNAAGADVLLLQTTGTDLSIASSNGTRSMVLDGAAATFVAGDVVA